MKSSRDTQKELTFPALSLSPVFLFLVPVSKSWNIERRQREPHTEENVTTAVEVSQCSAVQCQTYWRNLNTCHTREKKKEA